MPKRIPISALKAVCKAQGLNTAILFANDGKLDHIVTYGKSLTECARAAQFGNMLKDVLKWPASLHADPARLISLRKKVDMLDAERAKLVSENAKLINLLLEPMPTHLCECFVSFSRPEDSVRCKACKGKIEQWDKLEKIVPRDRWPTKARKGAHSGC